MFPLRDSTRSQTTPIITYVIIALNTIVFFYEASLSQEALAAVINQYGLVPVRLLHDIGPAEVTTIFSSMFMHGGWMHLISNMWALFIFGDNIEDRMGHFRFLLFYLIAGVAAAMTQVAVGTGSSVPMIGASGAIAGVLGAYLLTFPHARVLTLMVLGIFSRLVELPAIFYLGFWFLTQFFTGVASLSVAAEGAAEGIAWWAHMGGFIAGIIFVKLFHVNKSPS